MPLRSPDSTPSVLRPVSARRATCSPMTAALPTPSDFEVPSFHRDSGGVPGGRPLSSGLPSARSVPASSENQAQVPPAAAPAATTPPALSARARRRLSGARVGSCAEFAVSVSIRGIREYPMLHTPAAQRRISVCTVSGRESSKEPQPALKDEASSSVAGRWWASFARHRSRTGRRPDGTTREVGLAVADAVEEVGGLSGAEGTVAGDGEDEDAGQGEDVAGRRVFLSGRLLGGHEGGGAGGRSRAVRRSSPAARAMPKSMSLGPSP